jgi:rRNA maturation protein Nop10
VQVLDDVVEGSNTVSISAARSSPDDPFCETRKTLSILIILIS